MINALIKIGNITATSDLNSGEVEGKDPQETGESAEFAVELALVQSALSAGSFEQTRLADTQTSLARSLPVITVDSPMQSDGAAPGGGAAIEDLVAPLFERELTGDENGAGRGMIAAAFGSPLVADPRVAEAAPPSSVFEVEFNRGQFGEDFAADPTIRRASLITDGAPLDLVLPRPLLGGSPSVVASTIQAGAEPAQLDGLSHGVSPHAPQHGSWPLGSTPLAPPVVTAMPLQRQSSSTGEERSAQPAHDRSGVASPSQGAPAEPKAAMRPGAEGSLAAGAPQTAQDPRQAFGLVSHASNMFRSQLADAGPQAGADANLAATAVKPGTNGISLTDRISLTAPVPPGMTSPSPSTRGAPQAEPRADGSQTTTPTPQAQGREASAPTRDASGAEPAARTEASAADRQTRASELAASATAKPHKEGTAKVTSDGSPILIRETTATNSAGTAGAVSRSMPDHGASMGTAERQEVADLAVSRMTLRHGARAAIDIPDFGRVTVDARMRAGQVDLSVVADRATAANALQAVGHQLESELRNAQVPLKELTIDHGSAHQRPTGDPNGSNHPNGAARSGENSSGGGKGNGEPNAEAGASEEQPATRPSVFNRRVRIVL